MEENRQKILDKLMAIQNTNDSAIAALTTSSAPTKPIWARYTGALKRCRGWTSTLIFQNLATNEELIFDSHNYFYDYYLYYSAQFDFKPHNSPQILNIWKTNITNIP